MKKKKIKFPKIDRTSIYEEFCVEMDLFSDQTIFPDWIFDFREQHLSKMSSKLIKICRKFKQSKIDFRILYPMQIDRKWKFADIYIPSAKTVVMVTTIPHSPGWLTQRAAFFTDRCKVYELDGDESTDTLNNLIEKIKP